MKIRLWATKDECRAAAERLMATPGLVVLSVSEPYPDHGASVLVRVFIEARLDPPPEVRHGTAGDPPQRPDQRASALAQQMTSGRRRRALHRGAVMADHAARRAWQSARTLADLGQLTARWLEGTLPHVPGYAGPPDPETLPLVPVLAHLNRAGYVTCGSQPGMAWPGYDGGRWEQRASVEGFAGPNLAARIGRAADAAGLITVAYAPAELPRWRIRYGRAVPVTRRNGEAVTRFGAHLSRRHLRDSWTGYGACHRDAVNALCGAWQVSVIDPLWGRPGLLWRVLADAVRTPEVA